MGAWLSPYFFFVRVTLLSRAYNLQRHIRQHIVAKRLKTALLNKLVYILRTQTSCISTRRLQPRLNAACSRCFIQVCSVTTTKATTAACCNAAAADALASAAADSRVVTSSSTSLVCCFAIQETLSE